MDGSQTDTSGNTTPIHDDFDAFYNANGGFLLGGNFASGSLTCTVTQSYVYVWASGIDEDGVPIPTSDPPKKAYFGLTGDASTLVNIGGPVSLGTLIGEASSLNCTADDGLGDSVPDSPSIIGAGDDGSYASLMASQRSTGTHVVLEDGSSGQVEFDYTSTVHCDGTASDPNITSDLSLIAAPTEVQSLGQFLITSSIDASQHVYDLKDPSDNGINMRDSDGAITGDSAASWNYILQKWEGVADFSAGNIGFSNPSWQWMPGGSTLLPELETNSSSSTHYVFDLGGSLGAQELGQMTTTNCTLSDRVDSDGTTADNKYAVNWHLPIEDWSEYQPAVTTNEAITITVDAPGYGTTGFGVLCHWNEQPLWGQAGNVLSGVGPFVDNPVYSGLFSAASIIVNSSAPTPYDVTPDFNQAWGASGSTFSPSKDDTQKDHYRFYPRLYQQYTTRYWQGQGFGAHGYIGYVQAITKRQSDVPMFEGDFYLADSTGGGANG